MKVTPLTYVECPKCGSNGNTVMYHASCPANAVEHLHLTCTTCQYSWTTRTRDAK